MRTLILAELYKIRHGRLLTIILVGVAMQIGIQVAESYVGAGDHTLGQYGITMISKASSFLSIWIIAFVAFFIATEFQNGTIRNMLALGKSRVSIFLSKLLSAFVALAAILAVVSITATIGYTLEFGFGDMATKEFAWFFASSFAGLFFFHCIYAAIFTVFAFITRNAGMTVLLGVGYMIVELVVIGMLSRLVDFAPQLFPVYYILKFFGRVAGPHSVDATLVFHGVIATAVFILAAVTIGLIAFEKSDVR